MIVSIISGQAGRNQIFMIRHLTPRLVTPQIHASILIKILSHFSRSRFEKLKAKDNDFEFRFSNLGNLAVKNGVTEFNWESNIENVQ